MKMTIEEYRRAKRNTQREIAKCKKIVKPLPRKTYGAHSIFCTCPKCQ